MIKDADREQIAQAIMNGFSQIPPAAPVKPKFFDGTVTITHLLMLAGVVLAFWSSSLLGQALNAQRITLLETRQKDGDTNLGTIKDTLNEIKVTNKGIEVKLSYLAKEKNP